LRRFYKVFRGRLREDNDDVKESWSLKNGTKIKLVTKLSGSKDYQLCVTVCGYRPRDGLSVPALQVR
jgi:hypothetical protein